MLKCYQLIFANNMESSKKCVLCQKTCDSRKNMKKHMKEVHSERVSCYECEEQFVTPRSLNRHVESVHDKKIANSPACFKEMRKDNLKKHLNRYGNYVLAH